MTVPWPHECMHEIRTLCFIHRWGWRDWRDGEGESEMPDKELRTYVAFAGFYRETQHPATESDHELILQYSHGYILKLYSSR